MTFCRHPLHPALVHFPIACWTLAVLADISGLWLGDMYWRSSAGLLVVGCSTAVIAMLTGMLELARVPDGKPMRDTYLHMGLMLGAFTFFTLRLTLRLDGWQPLAPNNLSLLLDAIGFIFLLFGGWQGGKLVFRHGIGCSN